MVIPPLTGVNTPLPLVKTGSTAAHNPVETFDRVDAFLDLSTRGKADGGGGSAIPTSKEEALALAETLGNLIRHGIIGYEWYKDAKGVAHRVFLENSLAGTPKDYKPLRPGEKK